ncbi:MAG: rhodanese-like domain-containing protein [Kofleriaceae bacterium]|nr:rhodanese-like domain-containing protein [Kofleriaceae bacterium]
MKNLIDRTALTAKLTDPRLVLLEALPEKYYTDGHLPGARWFPHDRAKELATVAVPRKDAPVVVYCASATCQNSHVAAKALTDLGYTDVQVYAGGKADWEAAGLPFERG